MSSCVISQSNYIPWKGYFDQINSVDDFVLYDCVQYTRRDWRNRNRIKTAHGTSWLTVPVQVKGNYDTAIDLILVEDSRWADKHWQTIRHSYGKAPYFKEYASTLESCYESLAKLERLSEINAVLIRQICQLLGIKTRITDSRSYELKDDKVERLLGICQQLNATEYVSGPAAKDYLEEKRMTDHGISVRWMSYEGYPEYPQLYPPFEHAVSVLDLLFNTGPEAPSYMKSFSPLAQGATR